MCTSLSSLLCINVLDSLDPHISGWWQRTASGLDISVSFGSKNAWKHNFPLAYKWIFVISNWRLHTLCIHHIRLCTVRCSLWLSGNWSSSDIILPISDMCRCNPTFSCQIEDHVCPKWLARRNDKLFSCSCECCSFAIFGARRLLSQYQQCSNYGIRCPWAFCGSWLHACLEAVREATIPALAQVMSSSLICQCPDHFNIDGSSVGQRKDRDWFRLPIKCSHSMQGGRMIGEKCWSNSTTFTSTIPHGVSWTLWKSSYGKKIKLIIKSHMREDNDPLGHHLGNEDLSLAVES